MEISFPLVKHLRKFGSNQLLRASRFKAFPLADDEVRPWETSTHGMIQSVLDLFQFSGDPFSVTLQYSIILYNTTSTVPVRRDSALIRIRSFTPLGSIIKQLSLPSFASTPYYFVERIDHITLP